MRDDRDDRDDPFEEFFEEVERMMNEMMGESADFHFQRGPGAGAAGEDGAAGGAGAHVDVHETDDEVRVVADIPGVRKEDIDLRCDGETLSLQAASGDRSYDQSVSLPTPVDEHSASATYNNGVLEVSFDAAGDASTSIEV